MIKVFGSLTDREKELLKKYSKGEDISKFSLDEPTPEINKNTKQSFGKNNNDINLNNRNITGGNNNFNDGGDDGDDDDDENNIGKNEILLIIGDTPIDWGDGDVSITIVDAQTGYMFDVHCLNNFPEINFLRFEEEAEGYWTYYGKLTKEQIGKRLSELGFNVQIVEDVENIQFPINVNNNNNLEIDPNIEIILKDIPKEEQRYEPSWEATPKVVGVVLYNGIFNNDATRLDDYFDLFQMNDIIIAEDPESIVTHCGELTAQEVVQVLGRLGFNARVSEDDVDRYLPGGW